MSSARNEIGINYSGVVPTFQDSVFLLWSEELIDGLERLTSMPSGQPMNDRLAKEVEEQIFATFRLQCERHLPVDLPFPQFWQNVAQLFDNIEREIRTQYSNGGPDLKLQNLQKRQANLRRVANDLARRRLVAMMQQAVSQSFRSAGSKSEHLAPLDWARHDPAERDFFQKLIGQIEGFKLHTDWNTMQVGTGWEQNKSQHHSPGTTQLDDFVPEPGGLTGSGPPPIEIIESDVRIIQSDEDDEELIARLDAYPEIEESMMTSQIEDVMEINQILDEGHKATPELIPSKKKFVEDFSEWVDDEKQPEKSDDSVNELRDEKLVRIKILSTIPEAISVGDDEIFLNAGDIHYLDEITAGYLVESGMAEIASLD